VAALVDGINVGIVTVNPDLIVVQWNRFMQAYSGRTVAEVVGAPLFETFPQLPRAWLERKIRSVLLLKTFAFTSWRVRPFLFEFTGHRPVTGDADSMRQDCALIPLVEGGEVRAVSIVLIDTTDTYEAQRRLDDALSELAARSERDGLTGAYNRHKLEEVLATEVERARRYQGKLSLVMFDIDHFKEVNDQFGHLVGDEAIRQVARTAAQTLRTTDLVARYGGEEFVAVLPGVGVEEAVAAAERLRAAIAGATFPGPDGGALSITVSLGVSTFGEQTAATLLGAADQALYRSKAGGRNRVTAAPPAEAPPLTVASR
jgi:diguanylate cyclase (GGDEF)-like protein